MIQAGSPGHEALLPSAGVSRPAPLRAAACGCGLLQLLQIWVTVASFFVSNLPLPSKALTVQVFYFVFFLTL